ncbi:N-acetyl-gamma-glutamyl-phosphate reductase [Pseudomonas sp. SORGH_AS199]|nr:N-acetyl-gamma-glutamyl-phosphate reductase [Pseudomonas sp. SORGH_AS_0199]
MAFLCLPDAASREAVSLVTNPNTCIIDASTAFRTDSSWTYGLPELAPGQREALRASKRIANPGCHATGFILLARPLVDAGLLAPDTPLSAFSLTGYSGGGKQMIAAYEAGGDARLLSPRPYAMGQGHKHLPEMRVQSGLAAAPVFSPIVGPFLKGLAVTIPLHASQLRPGTTAADLQAALARHYDGEAFIHVAPVAAEEELDNGFFDVQASNDTNRADLFVFGNAERMTLVARLDNLGKGAAGAAVQCMNVHLGTDEGLGLASGR